MKTKKMTSLRHEDFQDIREVNNIHGASKNSQSYGATGKDIGSFHTV
jgi:hypothetical protein